MSFLSRFFLTIGFLIMVLGSCTNDMEVVNKIIDPEEEPDLVANNVELLYTDSARLQTKLVSPLVKEYTAAKEQRREFPEGLQVWFYEQTGELKGELKANWAKYDGTTEIWEARGNVMLTNAEGQVLETEQLFWDTKKASVYSEKYTKITQPNGSITAGRKGMKAKQDFSSMELFDTGHELIFEDNPGKETK